MENPVFFILLDEIAECVSICFIMTNRKKLPFKKRFQIINQSKNELLF